MKIFEPYEALFLLKGESDEMGALCSIFLKKNKLCTVIESGKIIISSKNQVNSTSISEHVLWLMHEVKDDIELISKAIENGAYISFTFFYPKDKPLGDILEPHVSKMLSDLNAPLHIHLRNNANNKQ